MTLDVAADIAAAAAAAAMAMGGADCARIVGGADSERFVNDPFRPPMDGARAVMGAGGTIPGAVAVSGSAAAAEASAAAAAAAAAAADDPGAKDDKAAFMRFPTLEPRRRDTEVRRSVPGSGSNRDCFRAMVPASRRRSRKAITS